MKRTKRDLGAINPRFATPNPIGHKINFTSRTLERLFASWRFGLLDENHLSQLLGSYGRHTRRELELTRAGLIYHPEAQVPLRAVCNDICWITALSNHAADTLAARGYRIDPTQHRERYRRHRSYNAILHDLNRSDFLVDLQSAVQGSGEDQASQGKGLSSKDNQDSKPDSVSIVHQDQLFGCPYTEVVSFPSVAVWKRDTRSLTVEPDGLFSLRFGDREGDRGDKFFALEIDQDTESDIRYRNFWDQKSVLKTMIAYGEAHKRGIITDKLGLSNLRTLFVTTTERHVNNILREAARHYIKAGYPTNAILFSSREALEHADPLTVDYKNAAGCSVRLSD